MDATACCRSAVSSTMAGQLPAPPTMAGRPELSAACTMSGPPVAQTMSTPESHIRRCVSATDIGPGIVVKTLAGAPAATAASLTMRTASAVHLYAEGCGANTTALRVLSATVVGCQWEEGRGLHSQVIAPSLTRRSHSEP